MSWKAYWCLSLALVLIVLGLVTRIGGFLILAVLLGLLPFIAWLRHTKKLRLQVERSLNHEQVTAGTKVEVLLTVRNEGGSVDELLLEDILPPQVKLVEGVTRWLTTLRPGEQAQFAYTFTSKRGSLVFPGVQVTASDTLDLFSITQTLPAPGKLVVLPKVPRIREPRIRPQRTMGFAGPIPAREGGTGTNFYGLREYQVGDPRRRINWRVSARHDQELFTNEFEQERIAQVGLILDAREQSNPGLGSTPLFEYSVEVIAALAEAFLNQGNRVGLLVYGFGIQRTFPGYGKVQYERILQTLADANPGHNYAFEKLDYLPTRFFPAHSQVVLVSSLLESDLPVLTRLRALGYSIMLVSPDPVRYEAQSLGLNLQNDLAARLAGIERKLLLQKIQRAGINVINWAVDEPLQRTINRALRLLPLPAFRIVGPL